MGGRPLLSVVQMGERASHIRRLPPSLSAFGDIIMRPTVTVAASDKMRSSILRDLRCHRQQSKDSGIGSPASIRLQLNSRACQFLLVALPAWPISAARARPDPDIPRFSACRTVIGLLPSAAAKIMDIPLLGCYIITAKTPALGKGGVGKMVILAALIAKPMTRFAVIWLTIRT